MMLVACLPALLTLTQVVAASLCWVVFIHRRHIVGTRGAVLLMVVGCRHCCGQPGVAATLRGPHWGRLSLNGRSRHCLHQTDVKDVGVAGGWAG